MIHYINYHILKMARKLPIPYRIALNAPNSLIELRNEKSLVIWCGESDNTIYDDQAVNWAFRAIHDFEHLKTGLDFTPHQEIELGRRQAAKAASQCNSLLADVIFCEVAEQAAYYLKHGVFVPDQVAFTKKRLNIL